MKFSPIVVVLASALGIGVGAWMAAPQPHVALAQNAPGGSAARAPNDGKVHIIVFGAHPDDPQYEGAGVAMKWARRGDHVKLVSATNGDIGHWAMAGGPLADRRKKEVIAVDERLGTATEVLDIHDGEIMPTMDNRRIFARLVRAWNSDVVITHRPNDYHPDHRYTSILVQDSAYMAGVPFFTEVPPLKKNPIYLYAWDHFQHPYPFHADIAVGIDDVIEPTVDAFLLMVSQIQEGGADGNASLYPANDPAARQRRDQECRQKILRRYAAQAENYRDTLIKFYGPEKGKTIKYAQVFEICEYGRQPSMEEIKQIFPF